MRIIILKCILQSFASWSPLRFRFLTHPVWYFLKKRKVIFITKLRGYFCRLSLSPNWKSSTTHPIIHVRSLSLLSRNYTISNKVEYRHADRRRSVARRRRYFAHSWQCHVLSNKEIRRQFPATARDSAANYNRCIFSYSSVCSTNTVHGSSDNNSLPNSAGELSAAHVRTHCNQLPSSAACWNVSPRNRPTDACALSHRSAAKSRFCFTCCSAVVPRVCWEVVEFRGATLKLWLPSENNLNSVCWSSLAAFIGSCKHLC